MLPITIPLIVKSKNCAESKHLLRFTWFQSPIRRVSYKRSIFCGKRFIFPVQYPDAYLHSIVIVLWINVFATCEHVFQNSARSSRARARTRTRNRKEIRCFTMKIWMFIKNANKNDRTCEGSSRGFALVWRQSGDIDYEHRSPSAHWASVFDKASTWQASTSTEKVMSTSYCIFFFVCDWRPPYNPSKLFFK